MRINTANQIFFVRDAIPTPLTVTKRFSFEGLYLVFVLKYIRFEIFSDFKTAATKMTFLYTRESFKIPIYEIQQTLDCLNGGAQLNFHSNEAELYQPPPKSVASYICVTCFIVLFHVICHSRSYTRSSVVCNIKLFRMQLKNGLPNRNNHFFYILKNFLFLFLLSLLFFSLPLAPPLPFSLSCSFNLLINK